MITLKLFQNNIAYFFFINLYKRGLDRHLDLNFLLNFTNVR